MNLRKFTGASALLCMFGWQMSAQSGYVLGVSPSNLPSVITNHNLTVNYDISGAGGPYLIALPSSGNPGSEVESLQTDSDVLSLERDRGVSSAEASPAANVQGIIAQLNDAIADSSLVPFFGGMVRSAYLQQQASNILDLQAAQQTATGGGIVAVIDTGVDPNHPALAGALVQGYDFTRNQATIPDEMQDLDLVSQAVMAYSSQVPQTSKTEGLQLQGSTVAILDGSTVAILDGLSLPSAFGHGTMTAGLIHLVAPTASIMPLKAFRSDGTANLSDVVRAIFYAVDHGASVINMSFDIQTPSLQLSTAIAYATSHGVICVAAAGNEGQPLATYPSSLNQVIGVASTSNSDQRSIFSNFGTGSEAISAPGEGLITPYPGSNYAGVWGTSFSAALVSGAVADLLQVNPQAGYSGTFNALNAGQRLCPTLQVGRARLDVLDSIQAVAAPPEDLE